MKPIASNLLLLAIGAALGLLIGRAPSVFLDKQPSPPATAKPQTILAQPTPPQVGTTPLAIPVAAILGTTNLDAAFFRAIAAARSGQKNQQELQAFIGSLTPPDVARVIALAQQLTDRLDRTMALQQLARRLSETNPKAAASLVLSLDPSLGRDRLFGYVAGTWAATDPRDAVT